MLAIERQNIIMELLKKNGSVTVSELSKKFDVTVETIRRDLEKLEKQNQLRRVHGGAYIVTGFEKEAPIKLRENLLLDEKQRIGNKCCEFIEQYDSIMLDSSTTALFIARKIKKTNKKVTIITNSLDAIKEFEDSTNVKVICTGGTLRTSSRSFTGFGSLDFLKGYIADKAFVSAAGIHMKFGITDHNDTEAKIRQLMLQNVNTRFFIADSTKFDKTSVNIVCDLEQIDTLITDATPSQAWISTLKKYNINLVVCD
jgi:DeoR/GlpR family transcriptional regulator of sugar metabolism